MIDIESTARDACASAETRAAKAASRLAAAREAWSVMRRRAEEMGSSARDFANRAPQQARDELVRRRSDAAARLESLAETIRPDEEARARDVRRTAAIAGGSTLILAVALGAGVAIGMLISKRSKQKRAAEQAMQEPDALGSATRPVPDAPDAFTEVGGLPH
jgi:hypothetical protein